ncbi:MAG TPA: NADH-quinone oxidoreductase subunit NuoK [Phycisphaerae bacterium]|nr:NADH-quinone oxidoreductase subunit NuoK [Phycisphaerae bacterium]HNU44917.1 NADH-quinone oxidoreductase subunit NuoK [Phycisphaerae bacterium]
MDGTTGYVIVGALLFALGLVGFVTRRNLIVMFLCTEVMFQGVLLNVVALGGMHANLEGQAFGLFLLAIAAVEAGLALGLLMLLYRAKATLDAEVWSAMRG